MSAELPPDGIARRTFIVQSALLAAAAALAACAGGGGSDISGPSVPTSSTLDISKYPALANVGGVAMVSVSNAPLAIVRTGASSFLALSRICPHQGSTIQPYGTGFRCPNHGATFTGTGQWTGGQRTSSMYAYKTSYDDTTGILTIN
jgi:thiosulfate dehydrogenase [quinone] large subunit